MSETKQQARKRLSTALGRLAADVDSWDEHDIYFLSMAINKRLEEMTEDDKFGTEGQCHPCGDRREGEYDMFCVEGVDD